MACAAVVSGSLGFGVSQVQAAPILAASDVAAGIDAPDTGGVSFPVTASITNTGLLAQDPGSTLTIRAVNGSVSQVPDSGDCSLSGGVAICTAGDLASGAVAAWVVTVAPDEGATSVGTIAEATAANGELNVLPESDNNSATDSTTVLYTVAADLSSQPTTVRFGDDTLLTTAVTNTGPAQSVTVTIDTGHEYDPLFALPDGCVDNGGLAVVICTADYGINETKSFDIAVVAPPDTTLSSFESSATAEGLRGGTATASTVTNLYAEATAFVPAGDALADGFAHHTSNFMVKAGSAPGLFLDLNEIGLASGTMCGASACQTEAAEALFPNDGKYSGSDPAHPFVWDINYGQLNCNGRGQGAGCASDLLYYIPSGGTTPIKMEKCASFGSATATLRHVDEVCLQDTIKSGKTWTFRVALLRDIVIPIIGGVASGAR